MDTSSYWHIPSDIMVLMAYGSLGDFLEGLDGCLSPSAEPQDLHDTVGYYIAPVFQIWYQK